MKRRSRWSRWVSWSSKDARLLKRILLLGPATFLGGFGLAAAGMWIGAPRRSVVSVPELRAMGTAEARRLLRSADLVIEIGDSLPNPEVPRGAVLAQSPLPGREVAPGSTVRVILSTGRQRRTVPRVAELSPDQAVSLLTASGFTVETREVPDARRAGRIVGTEPAAGTVVGVPSVVRLLLSAGPPRVAVPALVGLSEEPATALLAQAGLRVGEVRRVYRPERPEGEVLSQDVAEGDSLQAGSAVALVVATGELPGVPVEVDP